jgi:hypothetical protein
VYMSLGVLGCGNENEVFFSDRLSASLHMTQMNLPACQLVQERGSKVTDLSVLLAVDCLSA